MRRALCRTGDGGLMDDTDRIIVNRLQGGFPICERPFAAVAEALGLSEDELIRRVDR
ncbi:MAG: Lrp/AsnC family transcriptional regulator, partial [Sulfuricellaceae bacterium]|nr:Lrp/AsnC family transcriptional regulator [Sulfuricellaceae bacterium]